MKQDGKPLPLPTVGRNVADKILEVASNQVLQPTG